MKEHRPKFTRCMRKAARRRDMAPTPEHLTAIRRSITTTAARFGRRLSPECIEDLVQEVFLGLWQSRAEDKLNCLPYVRRVAANVTVDSLRWQGAQNEGGAATWVPIWRKCSGDLPAHPRRSGSSARRRNKPLRLIVGSRDGWSGLRSSTRERKRP
jgi:DNA-directed RNA polymerase specialized sigma24 family protein